MRGQLRRMGTFLGLMRDNQKYRWTDRLTYGRTDAETRRRQTGKGENVHSMHKCPADAASHLDFIFRVSDFPPLTERYITAGILPKNTGARAFLLHGTKVAQNPNDLQ